MTLLDDLIDVVGENENHPLASLMEVIGVLIEKYEDEHVPELTQRYNSCTTDLVESEVLASCQNKK